MSNHLEKAYKDFEKLSKQIITFYELYNDSFMDSQINNSIKAIYNEYCTLDTCFNRELNNRLTKKERPKEEW